MCKLLIGILLLFPVSSFAQDIAQNLFDTFCKEVIKADSMYALRCKFEGIVLAYDPVGGEKIVRYTDTIDTKKIALFKKYSSEDQMKIVSTEKYPIFPLKDTVCIIDSNNALPGVISFYQGRYCFKIAEKYMYEGKRPAAIIRNKAYSYMYLKQFFIGKDTIGLLFSFDGSSEMFICSFKLNGCAPTFSKAGSCCG